MTCDGLRGYVLAGGESSRMQRPDLPRDKALLLFAEQTLLQRALGTLAQICANTSILCGTAERCERLRPYGSTVTDRITLCGPLGGLDAALHDAVLAGADAVLILPVDMPHLPAATLVTFVEKARNVGAAVACLRDEGMAQPLPAYVRTGAAPVVEAALAAGERRLLSVLRQIASAADMAGGLFLVDAEACGLPQAEVHHWFANVNTPGDLQSAQQLRNPSKAAASE